MHTSRVLFIVTSATRVKGLPDQTGTWLEEVAAPYYVFKDAKCEVSFASPKGGAAPLDPTSLKEENQTPSTARWEADAKVKAAFADTAKLSSVDLTQYDAVFFPGGHGTMEDFPKDASVKAAVEYFYGANKPVASVCHGPAALVGAVKKNGEPLVKGHTFTCFSDEEETNIGLQDKVPFLLESRLREQGGKANTAEAFAPHVVVSKHLVTGQNPASAIPLAEAVVHQLRSRASDKFAA